MSYDHQETNIDICKILGFDPDKTLSVTVSFEPNAIVTATAVQWIDEEKSKSLINFLEDLGVTLKKEVVSSSRNDDLLSSIEELNSNVCRLISIMKESRDIK